MKNKKATRNFKHNVKIVKAAFIESGGGQADAARLLKQLSDEVKAMGETEGKPFAEIEAAVINMMVMAAGIIKVFKAQNVRPTKKLIKQLDNVESAAKALSVTKTMFSTPQTVVRKMASCEINIPQ